MKRFLALFIVVVYSLSANACFAVSHLYFVKNTSKNTVKPLVEKSFASKKYILNKSDPYFGIKTNNKNSAVVVLQTSGANLFYYFEGDSNTLNSVILKEFNKLKLVYEESFNTTYLSTFATKAQNVRANKSSKYTFEEVSRDAQEIQQRSGRVISQDVLKGYVGQISRGTTFNAYLQTPINTANANIGDKVIAVLSEDWVYNNCVVAPQGSVVYGSITKARHATYGSMNGRVVIEFNQIRTPEGKIYDVSLDKVDFVVSNDGKVNSVVNKVATQVIIGAVLGLVFGLLADDASVGKSVAIGAAGGAATGVLSSGAEKGVDAEIPIYTELELALTKPLSVVLSY